MKSVKSVKRSVKAAALAASLVLASCGNAKLKDGVFRGASGPDDRGAWGEATVTVADGKIEACAFVTRQKDGSVKGAEYGMINGEISNADYYEKAQFAVRAMDAYAAQFAETGALTKVDAISGATIAYGQFMEAAGAALEASRK